MIHPLAAAAIIAALATAPTLARAEPAPQDSASQASTESAEGVAALAEAGLKVVAGVAVVPLGLVGAGSVATGASVAAGGSAVAEAGSAVLAGTQDAGAFASSPLTVSDDIVVRPQPAPRVHYDVQAPR